MVDGCYYKIIMIISALKLVVKTGDVIREIVEEIYTYSCAHDCNISFYRS